VPPGRPLRGEEPLGDLAFRRPAATSASTSDSRPVGDLHAEIVRASRVTAR